MKLAGSRAAICATVLAAFSVALAWAPPARADDLQRDDVQLEANAYFREDIVVPADGGVWQATVAVIDGGEPVDVYLISTTDLVLGYPSGQFVPIEGRENVTYASILWRPPDRGGAYSFIVDNLDNARGGDAVPAGPVTVRLVRSPPLRANAQAAAALGAGTTLCAALLAFAAVATAVYLKRRGPSAPDEAGLPPGPPYEVPVQVPARPRGAWGPETEDGDP